MNRDLDQRLLWDDENWGKNEWAVTHGQERAEATRKGLHALAEAAVKGKTSNSNLTEGRTISMFS